MTKHKVVIVGGGFGGVKTALRLAKKPGLQITLVSDRPTFQYFPALYRTSTGASKDISSIPLDQIFAGKQVRVVIGEAKKLQHESKKLHLVNGVLTYDTLVLALGVQTNYFGIRGLQEYSFGVKSVEDAERFKQHLHRQLCDEHKPDLNYVIVGGGPTGVEVAGALPHYLRDMLARHGMSHRRVHVDLVEAAPRLLPRLPSGMSRAIIARLKLQGVKIYTGKPVEAAMADKLMVGGEPIKSHTVVWTAGTANSPFYKANNFNLSPRGKVLVDAYLQAWPGVFVIGDNADTMYSGMAQTALHDAHVVANNIVRRAAGKKMRAYKPLRPVTVIPIAHNWAAVQAGPFCFYGLVGWWLRRAADLIGYHDIEESWLKAFARARLDSKKEDACPICDAQKPKT